MGSNQQTICSKNHITCHGNTNKASQFPYQGNQPLHTYIQTIRNLGDEIRSCGGKLTEEDLTFALLRALPHLSMPLMQVQVLSWTLLHLMMWYLTFAHMSLIFSDKHKNINPQILHLVQISHNHRIRILISTEEGNPIKDKDTIKAKSIAMTVVFPIWSQVSQLL